MFDKPASRINKKQLAANLPPDLVEKVRYYCRKEQLTQTEVMAMAVNAVAGLNDTGPLLRVVRERIMDRQKSKAKVHEKGPACRVNTTRIAAHFTDSDLDRVKSFSKEYGKSLNALIEEGMRSLVSGVTLPKEAVEAVAQQAEATEVLESA